MWVRPTLVSSSHGRRNLKASNYFILQAIDPTKSQKTALFYRVITKQFPHYKVSEGNEYDEIASSYQYLNDVVVPSLHGKITSKILAKWLKTWYDSNFSDSILRGGENASLKGAASTDDEVPSISHQSTILDAKPNLPSYSCVELNRKGPSEDVNAKQADLTTNHPSISVPNVVERTGTDLVPSHASNEESSLKAQAKRLPSSSLQYEQSNSIPSDHSTSTLEDIDNDEDNWWSRQGLGVLSNWFDSPVVDKTKKNQGQNHTSFMDIPIQFIALLTYPEVDPLTKKKLTYSDMKEIGRVKNRRKVLLFLTIYTFVVRWCSFDLFLIVLFLANCGVLFLMKNSGKVNMQMAKRTVRQRANYMKQWAGGLFKKSNSNAYPNPPQYLPSASSVQINKALTKDPSDPLTNGKKHKRLFAKKNRSPGNSRKPEEAKPKKKLFPRTSSKNTVNSLPATLTNCSEPDLNSVERRSNLMSIDNSSF